MRTVLAIALLLGPLGLAAPAGEVIKDYPVSKPPRKGLKSFFEGVHERVVKARYDEAQETAPRPKLLSRTRAAMSRPGSGQGLFSRLKKEPAVRPWKSKYPILKPY